MSYLAKEVHMVVLSPFAKTKASKYADHQEIKHHIFLRKRRSRTTPAFLKINHVNSERLATIGHAFPPFYLVKTGLDGWRHFGDTVVTTRMIPG
jgi:hypothetical protein